MREAISSPAAPVLRVPISLAIVAKGRLLFVSGQGPLDQDGRLVPGTFREEAERTLRNLRVVVEAAGGRLAQTVKANVYLADMADFAELNAIWVDHFPEPRPARTTVQSNLPGFRIEVDLVVALDDEVD